MEQLADQGDGFYRYVDTYEEAQAPLRRRAHLADHAGRRRRAHPGGVRPGAGTSYRLVGYDNRAMDDESFEDLSADAGELGAGHRRPRCTRCGSPRASRRAPQIGTARCAGCPPPPASRQRRGAGAGRRPRGHAERTPSHWPPRPRTWRSWSSWVATPGRAPVVRRLRPASRAGAAGVLVPATSSRWRTAARVWVDKRRICQPSTMASAHEWTDKKRYLWLIGLVVPSLAFVGYGMWSLTGWGVCFWIGPIVILVIVPAIDLVAGLDRSNPPDDVIEALEKDRYYRWVTFAFLPIQYAGFVGAMWSDRRVCRRSASTRSAWRSPSAASAASGSTPRTSSATRRRPTSAGCRRSRSPRASTATSTSSTTAATTSASPPRGPGVRAGGRNFYQFWPRTVFGSLRSAWNLERKRIARRKQHPFRLSNDVLNAWLMSRCCGAADRVARRRDHAVPGRPGVVGFSLLEVVNYMEHYGMLRQKVGVGERQRYERVDPSHSWNSNNIATNVLLYHLQRHSDHHANPTRRYQTLRDYPGVPVLPTGYAGMIVLAIVPAVWRRVMDPRVVAPLRRRHSPARTSTEVGVKAVLAACPPPGRRVSVVTTPHRRRPGAGSTSWRSLRPLPRLRLHLRCRHGDEREGFAAGTAWADPRRWCCPDCGVRDKVDFVPGSRSRREFAPAVGRGIGGVLRAIDEGERFAHPHGERQHHRQEHLLRPAATRDRGPADQHPRPGPGRPCRPCPSPSPAT